LVIHLIFHLLSARKADVNISLIAQVVLVSALMIINKWLVILSLRCLLTSLVIKNLAATFISHCSIIESIIKATSATR